MERAVQALVMLFSMAGFGPAGQCMEFAGPDNVAVVVNVQSADSQAVAAHYMASRNIPAQNLCELDTADVYQLPFETFLTEVKGPLAQCLVDCGGSSEPCRKTQ